MFPGEFPAMNPCPPNRPRLAGQVLNDCQYESIAVFAASALLLEVFFGKLSGPDCLTGDRDPCLSGSALSCGSYFSMPSPVARRRLHGQIPKHALKISR